MTAAPADDVEADDVLTSAQRARLGPVAVAILDGRPFPPRRQQTARLTAGALRTLVDHAVCSTADTETMTEATTQAAGQRAASRLCARCPVAYGCLAVGRATAASGLWGGVVLDDGRVAPRGGTLAGYVVSRPPAQVEVGGLHVPPKPVSAPTSAAPPPWSGTSLRARRARHAPRRRGRRRPPGQPGALVRDGR